MSQVANNTPFDELDPHGIVHGGGHHGHTIVPWQTQLFVLVALLILTALTVGVAQAEGWVMHALNVSVPHWVNIIGAMLIAVVKATLVCMFFMQLKYDKPLNTIVFLFCLFCVFLFMLFAMLDLSNRDRILEYKAGEIHAGGTGEALNLTNTDGTLRAGVGPRPSTGGKSIVDYAYDKGFGAAPDKREFWFNYYGTYITDHKTPHRHERDTEDYFDQWVAENHAAIAKAGLSVHHAEHLPDAARTVERTGLTPGLFAASADAEHGAAHDPAHEETPEGTTHEGDATTEDAAGHDEQPAADDGH